MFPCGNCHSSVSYPYLTSCVRKDDDLARLQENLNFKSEAEHYKKQLEESKQETEKYKQETEEYKHKLKNTESIQQRLDKENKAYQDKENQLVMMYTMTH